MNQLGQNLQAGAAKAVIGTAINGGSFGENQKDRLRNAILDTAAAQSVYWIGKTAPKAAKRSTHSLQSSRMPSRAAPSVVNGSHASVTEQSGIKAGDQGFNANVKGHTDLRGGVISSTQAAIDGKKNSVQTASLTTSDIENHSTYKASG